MLTSKQKFRTFFAIDLTEDVVEEVAKLVKFLSAQRDYQHVRWTKKENLHITIRFLGDISLEQSQKIITTVGEGLKMMEPFTLTLSRMILFPTEDHPIAIALYPEPLAMLVKLNQIIENGIADEDVHKESRSFKPHLTLGKIKSSRLYQLPAVTLPEMKFMVDGIKLYRSDTGDNGSVYTSLACLKMCGVNSVYPHAKKF